MDLARFLQKGTTLFYQYFESVIKAVVSTSNQATDTLIDFLHMPLFDILKRAFPSRVDLLPLAAIEIIVLVVLGIESLPVTPPDSDPLYHLP